MHAIILVMVLFLMNGNVQTMSAAMPDDQTCAVTGSATKFHYLLDAKVRGAEWVCMDVTGGEKT